MNYAICQINGRQLKVIPGQPFDIDEKIIGKQIQVKILLSSDEGKLKVGTPFLKEELTLDVLDTVKGSKIRVAKYHAKANFRKVTGLRLAKSRLVWNVKN
ncbi:50S ribosomal protein L21 [Candidatus Daviesbacteria bacterium RIFCSPLOWO2_01_FULL_39_12]|uniref:50S ribosomal protein L21 n=1 Tax=Candidatus Daviesbacteria bacterium RIFCSPLOWO2_01_FULL_39_12 TaxID=1797785 RepID=A0A1F5KP18_9BACT|nr:MAG: 50S ribosomal protein L21 [Candidatus Daviesbacteria bacterium RIFCSPHIGHO2_02_FULL_39_8]OGE42584.1 MAG: 50S ribosomal protein L21 [Candidatus Daviesbacteria bacterium RIFCSPLOWO2_01_FULL_39_12]